MRWRADVSSEVVCPAGISSEVARPVGSSEVACLAGSSEVACPVGSSDMARPAPSGAKTLGELFFLFGVCFWRVFTQGKYDR